MNQRSDADRESPTLGDDLIRQYQTKLQQMEHDAALTAEQERHRIAADLHDRIGQSLALAQIKLVALRSTVDDNTRAAIDQVVSLLSQSSADTRTLIFELSPPVLYDLGLKDALAWLSDDFLDRHGMHVELIDDGAPKPLDPAIAALVFRTVRELLLNVLKHAKVMSAKLSLRRTCEQLEITVEDAGVGFDQACVNNYVTSHGFGLFSVRERIARLGGTLTIQTAPQQGARVSLFIPLSFGAPAPISSPVRARAAD